MAVDYQDGGNTWLHMVRRFHSFVGDQMSRWLRHITGIPWVE